MDEIVEEFIKYCTVEQLNLYRLDGKPLLHALHLTGRHDLEQQLVSRGVDLNQRDTNGRSYIGLVNRWNRHVSADVMGEIASFIPLKERQVLRGVDKEFKSVIDKMNMNDFQNLSEVQRQKILEYFRTHDDIRSFEYVLERNMDPSGRNELGLDDWAIRYASRYGYLDVVDRLLQDERVDPSARNNWAIEWASRYGHLAVVDRLLQDPRVEPSDDNNWAIRVASQYGHLPVVERLLQDPRVDPSALDNWPIRVASQYGHLPVVDRLLQDPRVDPSAQNNAAIHGARENGHLAVVDRLMRNSLRKPSSRSRHSRKSRKREGTN